MVRLSRKKPPMTPLPGDEESVRAPVLQDSPDEDEPPPADEEAGPETAGSAAEAAAPEPELSRESEPAGYVTGEVGEPSRLR